MRWQHCCRSTAGAGAALYITSIRPSLGQWRHHDFSISLQDLQEATIKRLRHWSTSAAEVRSELPTLALGCGAVAALLCRSNLAPAGCNHRLTGAVARSAPQHCGMCCANRDKMVTDSKGLLVHGGQLFLQTWQVVVESFGWTAESIDLAVPHQVSKKVHAQGMQMTGIDADKVVATYPQLGNERESSYMWVQSPSQMV
jgi:3-oxoacyl-[acyl-carrier-protein] synthase-3